MRELEVFLASAHAYSDPGTTSKKETDESATFTYQEGDWSFHDNYFGGEPYGGRKVVFHKSQPVWIQVYYGYVVERAKFHDVYEFLKLVLRQPGDPALIRGPRNFLEGDWEYRFNAEGDLSRYDGLETIYFSKNQIYQARIAGGLAGIKDASE